MKAMAKPQPKPLVRFRTNGGGVFVYTGVQWVKADAEIMTNVATLLYGMVKFNRKGAHE